MLSCDAVVVHKTQRPVHNKKEKIRVLTFG